jgi:hypothetical protein
MPSRDHAYFRVGAATRQPGGAWLSHNGSRVLQRDYARVFIRHRVKKSFRLLSDGASIPTNQPIVRFRFKRGFLSILILNFPG